MIGGELEFGPFYLSLTRRELLKDGIPVPLGSRAFDLLTALVQRQGTVVGKDELLAEVWPDTVVEENNLQVQISALRKALGEGPDGSRHLLTVPGRGYRFVAPSGAPPGPRLRPRSLSRFRPSHHSRCPRSLRSQCCRSPT